MVSKSKKEFLKQLRDPKKISNKEFKEKKDKIKKIELREKRLKSFERKIFKSLVKAKKGGARRLNKVEKKAHKVGMAKVINRKVIKQVPRSSLDLRRRPEREGTVKQHGFKEMDISNSNFLFN